MAFDESILQQLQSYKEEKRPNANTVPPWLDKEKFEVGKLFFQKHTFFCWLCMYLSLVNGLCVNSLLEALVFTGQSDTPEKCYKRYKSTFEHVMRWHFKDVWNFQKSKANQSILLVRRMHDGVKDKMNKAKRDKSHITQYDMALTQFGFMGMIVTHGRKIGIKCTDYELECYTHFWAGIGYLLGINDRYNVCLRGYQAAVQFTKEIEDHIVRPGLRNPPKKFYAMANALVEATSSRLLKATVTSTLVFSQDIVGYYDDIRSIPILQSVSNIEAFLVTLQKLFLSLVRSFPMIENFLNKVLKLLLLPRDE